MDRMSLWRWVALELLIGGASSPCDNVCVYHGISASCKDRVTYGATHEYAAEKLACGLSHLRTLQVCSVCSDCQLAATGCSDSVPEPSTTFTAGSCQSSCSFGGLEETCKDAIQLAASHEFGGKVGSCALAHFKIQEQCPICGGCALETAQCKDAAPAYAGPSVSLKLGGEGCHAMCAFHGLASTCMERIQFGKNNDFHGRQGACGLSRDLVLTQCRGICESCSLEEAFCSDSDEPLREYNCSGDDDAEKWDVTRSEYCCLFEGKHCPNVSGPPLIAHVNFNCETSPKDWTEEHAKWCCDSVSVGCDKAEIANLNDVYQCSDDTWMWPAAKRSWCCEKYQKGCIVIPGSTSNSLPHVVPDALFSVSAPDVAQQHSSLPLVIAMSLLGLPGLALMLRLWQYRLRWQLVPCVEPLNEEHIPAEGEVLVEA